MSPPPSLDRSSDSGLPGARHQGGHLPRLLQQPAGMSPSSAGRSLRQGRTAVLKNARRLQRSALGICEVTFLLSRLLFFVSTSVYMHVFLQERYFLPSRNIVGKRKCHSYGILTPHDKENAQKLGVRGQGLWSKPPAHRILQLFPCLLCFIKKEQLTEVILLLLGAWTDPLSRLYWSMSQGQSEDFNLYSSYKALEMSDMVQKLREGVAKVAEKVNLHL